MPDAPWDPSPSTEAQHSYVRGQLQMLMAHDWSKVERVRMSALIDKLNGIRTGFGIKFKDIDGTDGSQR